MKLTTLLSPSAADHSAIAKSCLLVSLLRCATAFSFNPVPSPNLDFSQLGRIGLGGDFSGISLYRYEGQQQGGSSSNVSSVLGRYPDGGFGSLTESDGGIQQLCNFIMDGELAGVIVAGNFTSLGGLESQGIAMFNPNTSEITPLPGIEGQVNALYCDAKNNTVYIGGSFKGANSTNAIAWVGTDGWTNLPFLGFNGPVISITPHSNGNIVFGGSFTGLGNATVLTEQHQQLINIPSANISSGSSTKTAGFSDAKNIVCKTNGTDGAGNTWLLQDRTPGYLHAEFGYGFQPTKLTLANTHQDGRGTKTWRFTAEPLNGIMNFTYTDPKDGQKKYCTSECPLSDDPEVESQEFFFVNNVGMNGFKIDISDWYGKGGGLNGIQLYQNDIYTYAINKFNEPECDAPVPTIAKSTVSGPWKTEPSHESTSEYLIANINAGRPSDGNSVTFLPHIRQSGNYSVNMYTPGCLQDNSCGSRGRVNVTGIMGDGATFEYELWQTNNFDKYDQVYFGYIEAGTEEFRPTVTLAPSQGQSGNLTVVAQRVGFTLIDSTGGLNGLYEYDPSTSMQETTDLAKTTIDKAGKTLPMGAGIKVVLNEAGNTYVGGNYSTDDYDNIFAINSTDSFSLPGGGLNGAVTSMWFNDTRLYIGGNFTTTKQSGGQTFNSICMYHIEDLKWNTVGGGFNGKVSHVVPMSLNISGTPEQVLALSGSFDKTMAFGDVKESSANGFAVWVGSRSNWLHNLDITEMGFSGKLTAYLELPGEQGTIYAGSLSSSDVGANGVAMLQNSDLSGFPVEIEKTPPLSQSVISKRATASNVTASGVVTGTFYEANGLNVTVLGGHFGATTTDGMAVQNLVFVNNTDKDSDGAVTGIEQLSSDSTILAMDIHEDVLYAGGVVSGKANNAEINGLVTYNLRTSQVPSQPPALNGDSVVVYDIQRRESNGDIYVAGSFQRAGSLACPGICVYSTTASQWNRPGGALAGTVHTMLWTSDNSLLVGGELRFGGSVDTSIATYDTETQDWDEFDGARDLPGPVVAMTPANKDTSSFWVAGVATNGSTFLMKYHDKSWKSVQDLGSETVIRGLQIITTSKDHDSSELMPKNEVLILTGSIDVPNFGQASAVLYNGTTFQPYILASSSDPTSSPYLSQFFSQRKHSFPDAKKGIALGFVVLIGLAIALALVFLMVIAGILAERVRRKREGYVPAPTNMFDKSSQMSRLPPEQVFGGVGRGSPRTPAV